MTNPFYQWVVRTSNLSRPRKCSTCQVQLGARPWLFMTDMRVEGQPTDYLACCSEECRKIAIAQHLLAVTVTATWVDISDGSSEQEEHHPVERMTVAALRLKLAELPDDTVVLLARDPSGGTPEFLSPKTIALYQVRGEPWCGFDSVKTYPMDSARLSARGRAYREREQEEQETALVISPYEVTT